MSHAKAMVAGVTSASRVSAKESSKSPSVFATFFLKSPLDT